MLEGPNKNLFLKNETFIFYRICDHSLCINLYYSAPLLFRTFTHNLGFYFKLTFSLYKKLVCCVQDVPAEAALGVRGA